MGEEREEKEDDECFVCGNGGKLTCCDICPRVYHMRCLPAADAEQLRQNKDEDWWCPRCRRISKLTFCLSRELSHPAVGVENPADVAERLYAFMADEQHDSSEGWDALNQAGSCLMGTMPGCSPWQPLESPAAAASETARVHRSWWANSCSDDWNDVEGSSGSVGDAEESPWSSGAPRPSVPAE